MAEAARARPIPTPETQHFWDGTKAGELRLQRCDACDHVYFPPRPFCPACASRKVSVFPASGKATLYSYVINHRPPAPGFTPPYAIAVVELHPLSHWWTELYHDRSLVILDALEGNHGGITALAIGRIDEACLAPGRRYLILSAANLAKRMAAGEAIRPIALSGELRLCILEAEEALTAMPRLCVGA